MEKIVEIVYTELVLIPLVLLHLYFRQGILTYTFNLVLPLRLRPPSFLPPLRHPDYPLHFGDKLSYRSPRDTPPILPRALHSRETNSITLARPISRRLHP